MDGFKDNDIAGTNDFREESDLTADPSADLSRDPDRGENTGSSEASPADNRDFLLEYLDNRIRTSLNSLLGITRDGREDNIRNGGSEKVDQLLSRISILGMELKDSAAGILDLYKMGRKEPGLTNETIQLDVLIDRALDQMRQESLDRHVILRRNLAEASGALVRTDKKHFFRLVLSFLQTAVRFSAENSTVTLQVKRLGREGRRISYEFSAELTDSRLNQDHFLEMKTLYQMIRQRGLGFMPVGLDDNSVGLLLLFAYAELMGISDVHFRMIAGGFALFFTISMEEGEREKVIASWGSTPDLAGKWVLVAEDNKINQEVISRILTSYGMCVILAGDGQETLEAFQKNEDRIDLILMDIVMLNMNGLETTRQIRSLPSEKAKSVPVIAITADTLRRNLPAELKENGINSYLYKPIEPEALIREIRKYLRNGDRS